MTGPEHYRKAELLIQLAADNSANPMVTFDEDKGTLAAAQVHATLALAAAVMTAGFKDSDEPSSAWIAVLT